MSKCVTWGTSPFQNENRLNLRTVSERTKNRLATRADEMIGWELHQTKDNMIEQSMDHADRQETLERGITTLRNRASNDRARNRDIMKKVTETNEALQKTATEAVLEAQSCTRQLQMQTFQKRDLEEALGKQAKETQDNVTQLRNTNQELRNANRELRDMVLNLTKGMEGVEARAAKVEKQLTDTRKKAAGYEDKLKTTKALVQTLRTTNRQLHNLHEDVKTTMEGSEARTAKLEKLVLEVQRKADKEVTDVQRKSADVEAKLKTKKDELKDYKGRLQKLCEVPIVLQSHLHTFALIFAHHTFTYRK